MSRNPTKRKIPHSFRGRSGNNTGKTKVGRRNIHPQPPGDNALPYPRLYVGFTYPRRKQVSVGGETAMVLQDLLQRGGTSTLQTHHLHLKKSIRALRKHQRLRIMQRTRRWGRQTLTQYWLLDKVQWAVNYRKPEKGGSSGE